MSWMKEKRQVAAQETRSEQKDVRKYKQFLLTDFFISDHFEELFQYVTNDMFKTYFEYSA